MITKIYRQAAVYGKCIVADYNSVHKDKCADEFMKLKDCYLVRDASNPATTCAICLHLTYRNNQKRAGGDGITYYQ